MRIDLNCTHCKYIFAQIEKTKEKEYLFLFKGNTNIENLKIQDNVFLDVSFRCQNCDKEIKKNTNIKSIFKEKEVIEEFIRKDKKCDFFSLKCFFRRFLFFKKK